MNQLEAVSIMAVEDDPIQQASLEMTLDELGYDCVGMESRADKAMEIFSQKLPDIVLLDIQLSGKKDGIELGHSINKLRPTPLIYLTSFEDHDTFQRARLTFPLAYLIKPIKAPTLQSSIELAIRSLGFPSQEAREEWNTDILLNDSIFVKVGDRLRRIRLDEILWVETAGNRYCKIVSTRREAHVRASLLQIGKQLAQLPLVRIHRSFLINTQYIESIHQGEQTVEVGHAQLPIGESYKEEFFKHIQRF